MPGYGASLGVLKDVFPDPESSIWQGRGGVKVAVVLLTSSKNKERLDKGWIPRDLSASEENFIAGKKSQASRRLSTSKGWRDCDLWHDGGRFVVFIRYRVASTSCSKCLSWSAIVIEI